MSHQITAHGIIAQGILDKEYCITDIVHEIFVSGILYT